MRSRAILSSRLRLSSRYPEKKKGKKKRMNGKIRKEAHLHSVFLGRRKRTFDSVRLGGKVSLPVLAVMRYLKPNELHKTAITRLRDFA